MRKTLAIAAIIGLAAFTLVGCSVTGGDCPRPDGVSASTSDLVTVTGSPDAKPAVDVYSPLHVDELSFWDEETGDGTPISAPEQLVVLEVTLVDGKTGDTLITTPYDGSLSRIYPLSRWVESFPAFADGLKCATSGSRVTMVIPPGGIESKTAEGLKLGKDDTAVAVVDVRNVYLTRADGANQYISGGGMPTVVRAPNGRPGIIVPDGAPPKDLVVQVLKKGNGAEVTGENPVRVHYTGLTWAERKVFDTTWDGDPASVSLDGVVKGFADALKGQQVGSQVLVSIPPDLGYGDTQQGGIAAGSTLVFVIDILGIDPPAAAATQ